MIKSKINKLIISSKKRINWKVVEEYLKKYDNTVVIIEETTESVNIDKHFIDEYVGSKYTRSLKGTNALVKANIPIILEEIIKNSYNKRHIDDYNFKHKSFAKGGWNRYDSNILMPIRNDNKEIIGYSEYKVTLVVRVIKNNKLYLYDIINIKKETGNPL